MAKLIVFSIFIAAAVHAQPAPPSVGGVGFIPFGVNVQSYGAKCDGVTDDTAAVNAAIAAVAASTGGIVNFPAATCLALGQILLPNNGATKPSQKPIRLLGVAGSHNTPEVSGDSPYGGTILDLRYNGSGPAAIDTRGKGYLEIAYMSIVNGGTGTVPFVQTTNTMLNVHDTYFLGSLSVTGQTCNQDAIVLGGTGTTENGSATAPFQGYGTVIWNNNFNRIRRGVYLRTFANGVVIRDNTWWINSGAPDTTSAGIDFLPAAATSIEGVLIEGNIFESANYPWTIHLGIGSVANSIANNSFYDATATSLAFIRFETGADLNWFYGGLAEIVGGFPAVTVDDQSRRNVLMDANSGWLTLTAPANTALSVTGGSGLASVGTFNATNTSHGSAIFVQNTLDGEALRAVNNNVSESIAGIQNGSGSALYGSASASGTGLTVNNGGTGLIAAFQKGGASQITIDNSGTMHLDNMVPLLTNSVTVTGASAAATAGALQATNTAAGVAILAKNTSTGEAIRAVNNNASESIAGVQTGSGIGVYGSSTSGAAVYGIGTTGPGVSASGAGTSAILAVNTASGEGVRAVLSNGSEAVAGVQSGSGIGVYGSAVAGSAIYGTATSGNGVFGTATTGPSVYGQSTGSGPALLGNAASTGLMLQLQLAGATKLSVDNAGQLNVDAIHSFTTAQVAFNFNPKFTQNNSTGAGSAALGANSPAITLTAPYTWVMVITADGSTGYMPIWK